jgi:hypothetical protein
MNSTKARGERESLVNTSIVVEVEEFMLQQYIYIHNFFRDSICFFFSIKSKLY